MSAQDLELLPPEATGHGLWLQRVSLPPVAFIPGTLEYRDSLLADAALVETVHNKDQQDLAVEIWRNLRGFLDIVEKSRVATKSPVLSLGREIDDAAKAVVAAVTAEAIRIKRLCDEFQREQERQQREAERKIREEQERVARLAQEEQERLDKLAREEQQRAAAAATPEAEAKAVEVTQAAASAAVERVQAAVERVQAAVVESRQTITALASVVPQLSAGMSKRMVWKHEVTDLDALYRARPDLVKLEPRTREITSAIVRGATTIPGLKIWQESETGVRL